MELFDIHTHKIETDIVSSLYKVRSVLSLSPSEFREQFNEKKDCLFSCGVHPWDSGESLEELEILESIIHDKRIVAVGEVGLDKLRGPEMKKQIDVFEAQIKLAVSHSKPLIIHCVKAWDELIFLYKKFKTDIPWIIHGYRGNPNQTHQLVNMGFKFSFGEKFNRESLLQVPYSSIFCETDDSDIHIAAVYELISLAFGMEFEQIVKFVSKNMSIFREKVSE